MISQTLNLAPADKKLYNLRDSISAVESIPLIASSIMSKKIACGADKIVLDITVGHGAFMKNMEDAKKLAEEMIEIGKLVNRETVCVLTNMDQPLGKAVGNSLEVIEAIKALNGEIEHDLEEVVLELGSYMVVLSGIEGDLDKAKKMLKQNLYNGNAYNKFKELVENQNGDVSYIENVDNFEKAKYIEPIYSKQKGFMYNIDAKEIGKIACDLGAGRMRKEDTIDSSVGIILNKKMGDMVYEDDVLAYVHANDIEKLKEAISKLEKVLIIKQEEPKIKNSILKIIK